MKKINKLFRILAWLIVSVQAAFLPIGCSKSLEVDLPIDKNTGASVYANSGTAIAAMTGVYVSIRSGRIVAGDGGTTLGVGLLSDELLRNEPYSFGYQINEIESGDEFIWKDAYLTIYKINSIIEGISVSKGIPEQTKNILLGEAKFTRAFLYFNLVNYYGDVPLVTTTNLQTNLNIPRSPVSNVYQQVISDLLHAKELLSSNYLNETLTKPTTERVRPNRSTASSLLARVYLYTEQWQKAEVEASSVINDGMCTLKTNLNEVFLKNNSEAIWQIQPIGGIASTNVSDAKVLIPRPGDNPSFIVNPVLLNSFESNDLRKSNWIKNVNYSSNTFSIPYKYKVGRNTSGGIQPQTEYLMVLRLAEQYLIRAEARARQGNIIAAQSDLNVIRNRAGLPNTNATTQSEILDAVLHERRVELFLECGQRWLDLKRFGKIDEVMSVVCPLKGGTWASFKSLFPIPSREFQFNPALKGHQNPGYSE